jgi:ribonucleoside-diphosphate reductase alpha chain
MYRNSVFTNEGENDHMAKRYRVIKRNGETAALDIAKIRKVIQWAAEGLDINPIELESNLEIHFRNNMTTGEIHETVIETSLRLTSIEEPDWRILAARLKLVDFYKRVHIARSIPYEYRYPSYCQTVKDFVAKGIYTPLLLEKYSDKELHKAGQFLQQDYDYDFDYAGISLLIKRYMLEYDNQVVEMPQEALLTIALLIEQNQPHDIRLLRVRDTYSMLARRKISLATPILINLRKPNGNLSSCFITAFDDDTNSIFHTFEQVGQISSGGGGVGVSISRIRSQGARIRNSLGRAGGVVPNIRVVNDIALYFNQGGKRAGAVTVALDSWHLDIEGFLELQTENGDQRRKAYDVFPQVVVTDRFMRAVENSEDWYLFDPHEIRSKYGYELADLWGEKFEKVLLHLYDEVESGRIELYEKVNAKALYKQIMKVQIESGMPYIAFKDTINRANPNKHVGIIPCTNLCVESFSVVKPTKIGPQRFADDNISRDVEPGLVHTCNLVSINLANLEDGELPGVCETSVRILDNCIDITDVPVAEGQRHNELLRTIGVGLMGLADYLAKRDLSYVGAADAVEKLAEAFAYHCTSASCALAQERGHYPLYEGSDWSNSLILSRERSWFAEHASLNWDELFDRIGAHGIRNSHITAIAPNTSSSIVQGCTASILPIFSKFYLDNNSNGTVPIVPPFIKDKLWQYQESKHIDQKIVVDVVSRLQKYVDTGISMELLFNLNKDITAKDIYETHMDAWKKGCKAIYYTRSIQKNGNISSEKEECVSCAG